MENIGVGLMLMVVGMATVFVILLIVIYLSKYLITVVNKVAPEEAPKKAPAVAPTADTGAMDAIKAAVEILTAGKGQVIKIEKLKSKKRKTHLSKMEREVKFSLVFRDMWQSAGKYVRSEEHTSELQSH